MTCMPATFACVHKNNRAVGHPFAERSKAVHHSRPKKAPARPGRG
jgi:hypothetical protein